MTVHGRPQRPGNPSVVSSVESAMREVRRPGPVEFCWNWRLELSTVAVTTGLCAFIAVSLGVVWLAAAAGAGLAAVGAMLRWPPARARLTARAWCVITPHRIRAGCASAWVQTRRGRMPIVLYTLPASYGERAQLWCRAGITAADLFAARDVLAAACWAAEVRVVPNLRHTHLVTVEVVRHPYPERTGLTPLGWPFSEYMEEPPARSE